ncbi:MAG: hypothetical protein NTY29_11215 [Proteobacteria bacterium]|nr:hypothetical protein [Pseudomonadota bacterium]
MPEKNRRLFRPTPRHKGYLMEEQQKTKWYNNRAKVIFSLQAFPPLGIYALLRSSAFTVKQKWLVALGVTALIALFIYTGIGAKMNRFVLGLFT